ncbi:MAG: hypothetical protein QG567_2193 [Campylobacterota bacterium]|nr:hypothetical protein [Campylobacterota bacterium]MDQ1341035.1 hypothetical protein [Campylobacterota bacterium]
MKNSIEKLKVDKNKFDINLKFYFILKYLLKAKLSEKDIKNILELNSLYKNLKFRTALFDNLEKYFGNSKTGLTKYDLFVDILDLIKNNNDVVLLIFSLKLIAIKPLLLQEAKIKDLLDLSKLKQLNPLSTTYDKITLVSPYSTRVSGALLSLIFFDKLENNDTAFLSSDTTNFLKELSAEAINLKKYGIEPNQIFMLMFSESINQSITSDSGSNYEDRILSVLVNIGIDSDKISKIHDKNDSSTEFDFFFELEDRTFGIGAKRTLRERYKQFIKTAQMSKIDVMIEITLGIDLTEEKVKTIRNHNIYLFVADEIYHSNPYLKNNNGVFSTKDLDIDMLKKLK